jgi:Domain of unknown function (DUF4129)
VRRFVLAVCVALAGVAHADIDPSKVEHARTEALTDDFQPTLPGSNADADVAGPNPNVQRPREREIRYVDTRDLERDQPTTGSTLLSYVLWAGIIIGLGLLLFWLAAELLKYGGDDAAIAQDAAAPAAPDLAVIERPLGDAEELARRGEYREAIHTLLLRTLQELARTASVRVAPAMTSREILGRVPLLADAREALANLITAVELTHFGGDDASEADYIRCRAQFQVFATAFRGRAA